MHVPHPIRWLRTHPRGADALLAALVVAVALAAHLWGESTVDDPNEQDPAWWTVLLVLAGSAPVYWRRTRTLAAGVFVVAAETTSLFVGIAGPAFLGSIVAVYSIGAHTVGPHRTRAMTVIGALVLGLFVAGWIDGLSLLDEFISTGIVLITAFVVGDNLRRRREHVADLAERAERLEREQGLLAEQRVAAERTRIARDLHDVVAHSVSVMVIQAAAARRSLDTDPEGAAAALESIETTGRQTMTELRAILGVLRTDDAGLGAGRGPQPSLAHLESLVDAEGVSVQVVGDVDGLADSVSATGYRLVQEALTNVRRHGGPTARAEVRLEVSDSHLVVEVLDDGRGAGAHASDGGFGIVGMRERVAALAGTFEAGPRPGGGWRVRAEIPRIAEHASARTRTTAST